MWDPKGSIAASAAYIIDKNCVQLFPVDRSLSSYYAAPVEPTRYLVGLRQSLVSFFVLASSACAA